MKVRKGDNVTVITGKDKGKTGTVTRVVASDNKVIVSGVNVRKKHVKSKKRGESGEIVQYEAPVDVSNISLVDPKKGGRTRVGYKIKQDGSKVRIAKKSGVEI